MGGRATAVWFVILIAAVLNGAVRDNVMAPRLGDQAARAFSCFSLATVIFMITWLTLSWIDPTAMRDAWTIGTVWLVMTLGFEFVGGHYVFGTPWKALLADYNIFAGRLWMIVLVATVTAPVVIYRAGENPGRDMEISSPRKNDTARP